MHRRSSPEAGPEATMESHPLHPSNLSVSYSNSATDLTEALTAITSESPEILPRSLSATNLTINETSTTPSPGPELILRGFVSQFYVHMDSSIELLRRQDIPQRDPHDVATTFAVAQDILTRANDGALFSDSDLRILSQFFSATHQLIDAIVEAGELEQKSWAWGIFGLCAGYIAPNPEALANFTTLKQRLHCLLLAMPAISQRARREMTLENVKELKNGRAQIHTCATLLLQTLKEDNWARVRPFHTMTIADRWTHTLGLAPDGY